MHLFGTDPAVRIDEVRDGRGRPVALFWAATAYSAVLQPGELSLQGRVRHRPGVPLTVRVPGPAGHVVFDLSDANVVGSDQRHGVRDGTYRIVPNDETAANRES